MIATICSFEELPLRKEEIKGKYSYVYLLNKNVITLKEFENEDTNIE